MSPPNEVRLSLPDWIGAEVDTAGLFPTSEAQVALAIRLASLNVAHASGGPFGAAVFDASGHVVALGVNRVLPERCSLAHAEIMAMMLAQQRLGCARLDETGEAFVLATSAQPCCQCYGAAVWSGIGTLLIGARAEDVEALTEFDEGPLPEDWIGELVRRGIDVQRDIHREAACAVLRAYASHGGQRY